MSDRVCPSPDHAHARWMTAAPASAAATECAAICAGVIGKYGDIDGVCIPPVIAQVMMTLSARLMPCPHALLL